MLQRYIIMNEIEMIRIKIHFHAFKAMANQGFRHPDAFIIITQGFVNLSFHKKKGETQFVIPWHVLNIIAA